MTKPHCALTRVGFLAAMHLGCTMTELNSTQSYSDPEARKAYNAKYYSDRKLLVREQQKRTRTAMRSRLPEQIASAESKTCRKCACVKPFSEFHIGKEYPDGRKAVCRDCMQAQRRAKYVGQRDTEVNKRRSRKATEEWQALKPQRKAQAKARLEKRIAQDMPADRCCTSCASILPSNNAYFHKSPSGSFGLTAACIDCLRQSYVKRAKGDPEKIRESARRSYARNAPKKLAQQKERRLTDPAFAIHTRVSSSVRQSLNRSRLGTSWIKLLAFSGEELHDSLEQQFTEGMSWDRFLAGDIEIDHIIPVSFFRPQSSDSVDFKMCWSLKNLQPLWRADNRIKSDTLPANFTELWNELYYEVTKNAS